MKNCLECSSETKQKQKTAKNNLLNVENHYSDLSQSSHF